MAYPKVSQPSLLASQNSILLNREGRNSSRFSTSYSSAYPTILTYQSAIRALNARIAVVKQELAKIQYATSAPEGRGTTTTTTRPRGTTTAQPNYKPANIPNTTYKPVEVPKSTYVPKPIPKSGGGGACPGCFDPNCGYWQSGRYDRDNGGTGIPKGNGLPGFRGARGVGGDSGFPGFPGLGGFGRDRSPGGFGGGRRPSGFDDDIGIPGFPGLGGFGGGRRAGGFDDDIGFPGFPADLSKLPPGPGKFEWDFKGGYWKRLPDNNGDDGNNGRVPPSSNPPPRNKDDGNNGRVPPGSNPPSPDAGVNANNRVGSTKSTELSITTKNIINKLNTLLDQRIAALNKWDEKDKIAFKNAFGNYDEDSKKAVLDGLQKMRTLTGQLSIKNFKLASSEDEKENPDTLAHVIPTDTNHLITLYKKYTDLPMNLKPESYKVVTGDVSKVWVLAHELSHFNDIFASLDLNYVRGKTASNFGRLWNVNKNPALRDHDLVKKRYPDGRIPDHLFNADSIAYYLEYAETQMEDLEKLEDPNAVSTPTLNQHAVNLTQQARDGKLDPAWGREAEINKLIETLSGKGKVTHSSVLTGEGGVGKTTIINGLAIRIAKGDQDLPEKLKKAEIYTLNLGSLVGAEGAEMQGAVTGRITSLLAEIKAKAEREKTPIILFIDEFHMISGAGKSSDSEIDFSNLIKEDVATGSVMIVGATTPKEYGQTIGKSEPLKRRFPEQKIEEPTVDQAKLMMLALSKKLENEHDISIEPDAVEASVKMAKQYMPREKLPNSSSILLHRAAENVAALQANKVPESVEALQRQFQDLKDQIKILQNTQGNRDLKPKETARLTQLVNDKKSTEVQLSNLKKAWQGEKELVTKIKDRQKAIASSTNKKTDQELINLQRDLQQTRKANGQVFVPLGVDTLEIGKAVFALTGIPSGNTGGNEKETNDLLRKTLKEKVIGQDHAVDKIADDILVARKNLKPSNKPVSVSLLLGPSGVGKTQLAEALSENTYYGGRHLIRINMTEFGDKTSLNRLTGGSQGYIGYGDPSILSQVRTHPNSVILLDEFDRAAGEVKQLFFNIFDKAVANDANGPIDFSNTVILVTSNLAGEVIAGACEKDDERPDPETLAEMVRPTLVQSFNNMSGAGNSAAGNAIVGRMSIIPFYPPTRENIEKIIINELDALNNRFKKTIPQIANITFSDKTIQNLADLYIKNKGSGIRGIQSNIQKIQVAITKKALVLDEDEDHTLTVNFDNQKVTVSSASQTDSGETAPIDTKNTNINYWASSTVKGGSPASTTMVQQPNRFAAAAAAAARKTAVTSELDRIKGELKEVAENLELQFSESVTKKLAALNDNERNAAIEEIIETIGLRLESLPAAEFGRHQLNISVDNAGNISYPPFTRRRSLPA